MDVTSNRSPDEDRVMQRQLYRAGQSQPAAKTPASAAKKTPASKATGAAARSAAKTGNGQKVLHMILLLGVGYYLLYGTPSQRRKTLIGLGVAGWLLLLGGISYCLCLPDLADMNRQMRTIFEDKNLTREEKGEKIRELNAKLTPSQRRQMREMNKKEWTRKNNVRTIDFLKLSPEDQVAQLKKEAEERQRFIEKMRKTWGNKGPRGNRGGNNGNKGNATATNKGNNGNGGGRQGGGGGGVDRDMSMLNSGSSPESRATGEYKRGLSGQLGLNKGFGGRGGPPGR